MMKINVSEIAEQIGHEKAFSFDAKPEDIGPLLDDCKNRRSHHGQRNRN